MNEGGHMIFNLDGPSWRLDNEGTYCDIYCPRCRDYIGGLQCGACFGGW